MQDLSLPSFVDLSRMWDFEVSHFAQRQTLTQHKTPNALKQWDPLTHSLTVLDANGQKAMAATAAAESGHLLSLTLTRSLSLLFSLPFAPESDQQQPTE